MSLNVIQCPWPASGADLSLRELNETEKAWLANEIVTKAQTPKQLSVLYNLKADTLRRYAQHLRERRPMLKFAGRPPAIDEIGISELCNRLRENPSLSKVEFDSEIDSKRLPTLTRRFCYETDNLHVDALSRRSLKRYQTRIKSENLDNF